MSNRQSTRVPVVCAVCSNHFRAYRSQLKNGGGKFCSRACYYQSQTVSLEERFFRYVGSKTTTGCILWSGCTSREGYGVLGSGTRKGRMLRASRIAYELLRSPIPQGLLVLHACDNPPCVNPAHLFLGTDADNMADKVRKGRQRRGETTPGAKLTDAMALRIREQYATGKFSQKQLAEEHGVAQSLISLIVNRMIWKHI